jgi:hypothetical protein
MAEKKTFKPLNSHRTTIERIGDQHLSVSFYGKIVDGISASPAGPGFKHPDGIGKLQAAQVFGYSQDHQCFRFTPPRIYMLPDPVGPADGCGWDPSEFVVWKVSPDWATLHFEVLSGAVGDTLLAQSDDQIRLSAGQSLTIASDCVFDETGNTQPVDRSRSLLSYGINDPEQASGVRTRIVGSPTLGVRRYNFQIDPNDLKDLSGSWTLGQLADRIQDAAIPV